MNKLFFALSLVTSLSLPLTVQAGIFPDVPDDHIYRFEIEQLVAAGVINGNPDGNFYPEREVNRAEMVKMLYKAVGRVPDATSVRCFRDIIPKSWYEPFVCDAAAKQYLSGYADGFFRPEQFVNRVEAIKLIVEIFGFDSEMLSAEDKSIINFADVSPSAWYGGYLLTAFVRDVLPIAGQEGAYFYPDRPLKRGEAAAYIYNAIQSDLYWSRETQNIEKDTEPEVEEEETTQTETTTQSNAQNNVLEVSFPFESSGKFEKTKPFAYRFPITSPIVTAVEIELQSGQAGKLTCSLFRLDEEGFSDEYFLGTTEGRHCYLLASLRPGDYQLQVQPSVADTTYSVSAELGAGDGNDGFNQAIAISTSSSKTHTLEPHNFQDWYTFSVNDLNGKRQMVELSNSTNLRCIVYAMKDVDLPSFEGPKCNQFFQYPMGTYYVAVGREVTKSSTLSYTVRLRE